MATIEEYHAACAATMSEKALDTEVRRLLKALNLYGFHPPDGTGRYAAGHPDWLIMGRRGILWRELKRQSGKATAEQTRVMELLRLNGADVDIWRPLDFYSGRITRELAAVAGLQSNTLNPDGGKDERATPRGASRRRSQVRRVA